MDQYSQFYPTNRFDSSQLEPGDLLFFNYDHEFDSNRLPILADHVAMYVGPTARNSHGEVIEAYSDALHPVTGKPIGVIHSSCDPTNCITQGRAKNDPVFATLQLPQCADPTLYTTSEWKFPCFLGLKRPFNNFIGLTFNTHSPIGLIVTDPEGFTITPNTRIITSREVLRIVPGQLSYVINSNDDDTVIAHTLKPGAYLAKPVPKPDATPGDTYTLTVTAAGTTLTLAQNIPISEIPSLGYGIESTGSAIQPFIPVAIAIKPGSVTNPINPQSTGTIPVAILSSASFSAPSQVGVNSLTFGRTGTEASLAFCNLGGEDVNGDGLLDLVCHFYTQKPRFQAGDTKGILRGLTLGGELIRGADSLQIVP